MSQREWTPLWSTIVDSSLWEEEDWVVKVFLTMLAKKDMDGVVRADAFRIGRWANKSEKKVIEALDILAGPDRRRLDKGDNEGRRIKKVPDGWLILNAQKYRNLIEEERLRRRRVYQAMKQREYRAKRKAKSGPVKEFASDENAAVRNYEAGFTDKDFQLVRTQEKSQ